MAADLEQSTMLDDIENQLKEMEAQTEHQIISDLICDLSGADDAEPSLKPAKCAGERTPDNGSSVPKKAGSVYDLGQANKPGLGSTTSLSKLKTSQPNEEPKKSVVLSKPLIKPLVGSKRLVTRVVIPSANEENDAPAHAKEEAAKSVSKPAAPKKIPLQSTALAKSGKSAGKSIPVAQKATSSGTEAPDPVPKRNVSAYMFYINANRQRIRDENPGIGLGEVSKIAGEQWNDLSAEEKAPYEAQAAEDKQRYERELEAYGGELPPQKGGKKSSKSPHVKTAYNLYCEEQRSAVKAENPKAGQPEIQKLLNQKWGQLSAEEKKEYQNRSKELKVLAAAELGNEEKYSQSGPHAKKKRTNVHAASSKPQPAVKRVKHEEGESDGEDQSSTPERSGIFPAQSRSQGASRSRGMTTVMEEDSDNEVDRVNIDWEAHPAEAILSKTTTHYIVLRRGLPLHEYGEVPLAVANALRAGEGGSPSSQVTPCPLTIEQVNEYERFIRTFKRDMFDCADGRELDLDSLRNGSLLEVCSFLGSMRSKGYELNAPAKKDDIHMKVPMMATSRLVQRLLEIERHKSEENRLVVEELRGEIADLRRKLGTNSE